MYDRHHASSTHSSRTGPSQSRVNFKDTPSLSAPLLVTSPPRPTIPSPTCFVSRAHARSQGTRATAGATSDTPPPRSSPLSPRHPCRPPPQPRYPQRLALRSNPQPSRTCSSSSSNNGVMGRRGHRQQRRHRQQHHRHLRAGFTREGSAPRALRAPSTTRLAPRRQHRQRGGRRRRRRVVTTAGRTRSPTPSEAQRRRPARLTMLRIQPRFRPAVRPARKADSGLLGRAGAWPWRLEGRRDAAVVAAVVASVSPRMLPRRRRGRRRSCKSTGKQKKSPALVIIMLYFLCDFLLCACV